MLAIPSLRSLRLKRSEMEKSHLCENKMIKLILIGAILFSSHAYDKASNSKNQIYACNDDIIACKRCDEAYKQQ